MNSMANKGNNLKIVVLVATRFSVFRQFYQAAIHLRLGWASGEKLKAMVEGVMVVRASSA